MARRCAFASSHVNFPSDIEILENQQADVLICHEAPKPHPMGFQVINDLAMKMGVKLVFHGHHHENFTYRTKYPYKITNGFPQSC